MEMIDAILNGKMPTDIEIEKELFKICDRVHSSCNDECPVYKKFNSLKEGDCIVRTCAFYKNGKRMLKFLRDVNIEEDERVTLATSYSPTEKIEKFNELHEFALEHVKGLKKDGYDCKDFEHYCYEGVLNLLGERIWDLINEMED